MNLNAVFVLFWKKKKKPPQNYEFSLPATPASRHDNICDRNAYDAAANNKRVVFGAAAAAGRTRKKNIAR